MTANVAGNENIQRRDDSQRQRVTEHKERQDCDGQCTVDHPTVVVRSVSSDTLHRECTVRRPVAGQRQHPDDDRGKDRRHRAVNDAGNVGGRTYDDDKAQHRHGHQRVDGDVDRDVEQVVEDATGGFVERPRRRRVLDGRERHANHQKRQVGDGQVQQQDVGWTLTSRPASHDHHDNEQVPDDADDCYECEHDGSRYRPQDVVELKFGRVIVVVVVVITSRHSRSSSVIVVVVVIVTSRHSRSSSVIVVVVVVVTSRHSRSSSVIVVVVVVVTSRHSRSSSVIVVVVVVVTSRHSRSSRSSNVTVVVVAS